MSGIMSMVLGAKTAIAAAVDAYFNLVTLLLPGDGTNGAQNNTFLDSSTNNFTITRNGNTTQGTFSPFSQTGWSNYFSGSGNYLSVAYNVALAPESGDFTVEAFVMFNSLSTTSGQDQIVIGNLNGSTGAGDWGLFYRASPQRFEFVGSSTGAAAGIQRAYYAPASFVVGKWYHLVGVKNGSTLSIYVDGVKGTDATLATVYNSSTATIIGAGASNTTPTVGYISNARVVKGTAVYSGSTITVPTAPLTAITNTSLLTCQDNRFKDNSTNAFSITVTGTPSIQAFSPFAPTAAYSAATNGGSGYFDGTGDYLTAANNAAFNFTGDFTIEAWCYFSSTVTSEQDIVGKWAASGNYSWLLYVSSGLLKFVRSANGTAVSSINGSTTVNLNAWNHVAVSGNAASGTIYLYLNGVSQGSATGVTFYNGTSAVDIGSDSDGGRKYTTGYISNVRLLKGTNLYPSGTTFTPPTAPPTAITNTQLLLNFTNAGITDATAKNVLETVGNAQISTTQSKFGGSSMYFDGTGDSLFISDVKAVTNLAAFRTGDFTIEMWVYPTANPSTYGAIPNVFGSSDGWGIHYMPSSAANPSTIRFDTFVSTNYAANNAVPLNQWTHIAVTRSGSSLKFWVNGTQSGSTATVTENFNMTSATFSLGNSVTVSREFFGYIDDFRITKGYARYTSNFTPPSAAFPLQ